MHQPHPPPARCEPVEPLWDQAVSLDSPPQQWTLAPDLEPRLAQLDPNPFSSGTLDTWVLLVGSIFRSWLVLVKTSQNRSLTNLYYQLKSSTIAAGNQFFDLISC